MDLWIRTQDRDDLLKVSRIKINYPISNAIQGITENNMVITLGIYEEEKRALEIIDEIQNILKPKTFIKVENELSQDILKNVKEAWENSKPIILNEKPSIQQLSTYVYEMPKE